MSINGYNGTLQTAFPVGVKNAALGKFWGPNLETRAYVNTAKDLAKIATLTLSTASGNQTLIIGGVTIVVPFTTDDAGTATAIKNAINATHTASTGSGPGNGASIAARVNATAAAGVVTITGKYKGDDFSLAYSGTGGTLVQDGTGASQVAAESSRIEFGLWVGANSSDMTNWNGGTSLPCRLPNSANTLIWGIGGGSSVQPYSSASVVGCERGQLLTVVQRDYVVAQLDSAAPIVPGQSVYYRHTANGGLNKIGASSNASGTGLTQYVGAKFVSANYTQKDLNLAVIRIGY
jgi:hypothetical protein